MGTDVFTLTDAKLITVDDLLSIVGESNLNKLSEQVADSSPTEDATLSVISNDLRGTLTNQIKNNQLIKVTKGVQSCLGEYLAAKLNLPFDVEKAEQVVKFIQSTIDWERIIESAPSELDLYSCLGDAYTCEQIGAIMYGIRSFDLTVSQLKVVANPLITHHQIHHALLGFRRGWSVKQVRLYTDPRFTDEQTDELFLCFARCMFTKDVEIIANPNLCPLQMRGIMTMFGQGYKTKYAKILMKNVFSIEQVWEIISGYSSGITPTEMEAYIDPSLSAKEISEVLDKLAREKRGN